MVMGKPVAHYHTPCDTHRSPSKALDNTILRSLEFWRRASGIYLGYKLAQSRAQIMRWKGLSEKSINEQHWEPHNARSGKHMYDLCVDLRGFFLKVCRFCRLV